MRGNSGEEQTANVSITWPDISFPPINLNVVVPAWFFYSTEEEREEYFRKVLSNE